MQRCTTANTARVKMTGGDVNAHARGLSGGKEKIDAKIDMCVSMPSPAIMVTHNPGCILSGTTSGFLNWVKGLSGISPLLMSAVRRTAWLVILLIKGNRTGALDGEGTRKVGK